MRPGSSEQGGRDGLFFIKARRSCQGLRTPAHRPNTRSPLICPTGPKLHTGDQFVMGLRMSKLVIEVRYF